MHMIISRFQNEFHSHRQGNYDLQKKNEAERGDGRSCYFVLGLF